MSQINHLNSIHLNYLVPLLKWRVLNLEELRRECVKVPNYFNFCKIIRSLEKAKVLEGYRHPFNHKKYVYLNSLGHAQLGLSENPSCLSKETLLHDIIVSEFSKGLVEKDWMNQIHLEHELHDRRNFRATYKIIPDALLEGEKKGIRFKVALELELSRKNNQRIIEKARQYAASEYYNYVLYLFTKKNFQDKYIELIKSSVSEAALNRFMFFFDEELTAGKFDLKRIEGFFKGKRATLEDVFHPT